MQALNYFMAGAVYSDSFVRVAGAWKIGARRADVIWVDGDARHVWKDGQPPVHATSSR